MPCVCKRDDLLGLTTERCCAACQLHYSRQCLHQCDGVDGECDCHNVDYRLEQMEALHFEQVFEGLEDKE